MTNFDYWKGRWDRGETGWHQSEVEPTLVAHFSGLKPTRVFVPLCGKSLDLIWLASQGHEVIGVELSEKAVLEFFDGNGIPFQRTSMGALTRYQGNGITIFRGDFFELSAAQLGAIGAVYDRAALIALPSEVRARYAAHMIRLLNEASKTDQLKFLQLVLERTPTDDRGPPYSVSEHEIRALYKGTFEITPLSRVAVDMGDSNPSKTEECTYLLAKRRP